MNKAKLISKIRSATLTLCIQNGINDPKIAKELLLEARDSVGKMSIAGVKAAMSKGQAFHAIEEVESVDLSQVGGCCGTSPF